MATANDLHKDNRVRSNYSDENQYLLDRIAIDVYFEMGIIDETQHDASDPQSTISVLQSISSLNEEQQHKFSTLFIDKIINNQDLLCMVPPITLAYAYEELKKQRSENPDDLGIANKLNTVAERIDTLSTDFHTNIGFYYADPSNIADVYDGYKKMFQARIQDVSDEKQQEIRSNTDKLEQLIQTYDEKWGISDTENISPETLEHNWDELSNRLNNINVSDSTLSQAAKYKFLDKDNNPIPQFIDTDGAPQQDYKDGYKLDENGRLQRVLDLSRLDIAFRVVAR